MADLRRPAHGGKSLFWDGTPERSAEIDAFTRAESYAPRWHWRPRSGDLVARLLTKLDDNQGEVWAVVPVGATVVQDGDNFMIRLPS